VAIGIAITIGIGIGIASADAAAAVAVADCGGKTPALHLRTMMTTPSLLRDAHPEGT
jgi:hypothetical protein